VLIVGEAPGRSEDLQGLPFVGKAGRMLREAYIDFFDLPSKVDVFLSNAVRCRPPQNKEPSKTQIKMCQGFLLADIKTLQSLYDEVIILAVGGTAVTTITGGSLKKWLGQQGETSDFKAVLKNVVQSQLAVLDIMGLSPPETKQKQKQKQKSRLTEFIAKAQAVAYPKPCRVFATYHPAYLLRNPSAGLAVHAHMGLLRDFLDGTLKIELETDLSIQLAPLPPAYSIARLAFDIETYGIFKNGPHQTQFHPLKMEKYDFVSRSSIIHTVGLSWRDVHGELQHAMFLMDRLDHRRRLWSWFKKIRNDPKFEFLVGQNINFDLVCLRHCYPECKAWVDFPLPIMDTIITNYLHDEGRPEKSLKNLAPLFRITKYDIGPELKRFDNNRDQRAWQYNCQDTYATLRLQEKLEEEIRKFYGPTTSKLTPYCMRWYNELLWLLVWMTETGIAMDQERLQSLFTAYLAKKDKVQRFAQERWNLPLRGKGSELGKREVITTAIKELNRLDISLPKLETTETKAVVSFCLENRNALLGALRGHPLGRRSLSRAQLIVTGLYQNYSKLLDAYLYPLLMGRGKLHNDFSTRIIDGVAYPRWFPVPSEYEDNTTGGTKQARIVCLDGSEEVITPRGFIPLKELVEKANDKILTITDDWSAKFVSPSAYLQGGKQQLFEITLSSAGHFQKDGVLSYVRATGEHEWFRLDGSRVSTNDLEIGTRLRHVQWSSDQNGYPKWVMAWGGRRHQQSVHRTIATCLPRFREGLEVHHQNENIEDWSIGNLQVLSSSDHRHLHWGVGGEEIVCEGCGISCRKRRTNSRRRFCSLSCWNEYQKTINYRVVSVRPLGVAEVYCLEVPQTHNFVLKNGLVSGNCKGPAAQTFPPDVKSTITCRFRGGYLIWFDYSQIELRFAALLSNDPVMMAEYCGKPDLHTKTARLIFGDAFADDFISKHGITEWKNSKYRQAGKTMNFLMLNLGRAERFQQTLMQDVGLRYPIEKCQAAIDAFWACYSGLHTWHLEVGAFIKKHGYFELPLIGQSRLFLGGRKNLERSAPEMANLPIQAVAAVTMQSSQFNLWRAFKAAGLRTLVPLNIYDAAVLEVPKTEIFRVRSIMAATLPNPPYFQDLCDQLGRRIPLEYDVKEKKLG